jgi:hypothetical protein
MDKIVIIAGIVAVVAVLAVTLMMSEEHVPTTSNDSITTDTEPQTPQQTSSTPQDTNQNPATTGNNRIPADIDYETAEKVIYGSYIDSQEASGCQLYRSSDRADAKMPYKCFGTANGIQTTPPSYYKPVESDLYFCTATDKGCGISEIVRFEWMD